MAVARRDLKEAGGEPRPRRTGTGYKAQDCGVSRTSTAKPGTLPGRGGGKSGGGGSRERDVAYPGRSLGLSGRYPDYSVSDDDG